MNWKASATDWMKSCSRITVMGMGRRRGRAPERDFSPAILPSRDRAAPPRRSAPGGAREDAPRGRDHRRVHHLAVHLDGAAAGGRIGLHHALRPGDLFGGGCEGFVHHAHLLRMDAELAAETEA